MTNSHTRLRLSPLFIRFADPEWVRKGSVICIINYEDEEGRNYEFYLHSTKGWKKRRIWG